MIRKSAKIAVITGGPGSGKTTFCEQLSRGGIAIGRESGRAILARTDGHDLREQSPPSYALEILQMDVENFKRANAGSATWLFDRDFADNAGFLDLMDLPIPNELEQACRNYRYAGPIFVAPPWREIYHGDDDRIQDWQEAKATYVAITAAWKEYGYDLVELPKASVEELVLFVKKRLA
jgi:predicted ATPase